MSGSGRAARRTALLASLLCAFAGCKREPPPPLDSPDPGTRAVELAWAGWKEETPDRLRRVKEYELALTPDRRFRYRWRNTDESPESWKEINGNWRPPGPDDLTALVRTTAGKEAARLVEGGAVLKEGGSWVLDPDLGRASLEADAFAESELPTMYWTTSLFAVGPEEDPRHALRRGGARTSLGGTYMIPAVDPETGRILKNGVVALPDPRVLEYPRASVIDLRRDR